MPDVVSFVITLFADYGKMCDKMHPQKKVQACKITDIDGPTRGRDAHLTDGIQPREVKIKKYSPFAFRHTQREHNQTWMRQKDAIVRA